MTQAWTNVIWCDLTKDFIFVDAKGEIKHFNFPRTQEEREFGEAMQELEEWLDKPIAYRHSKE